MREVVVDEGVDDGHLARHDGEGQVEGYEERQVWRHLYTRDMCYTTEILDRNG